MFIFIQDFSISSRHTVSSSLISSLYMALRAVWIPTSVSDSLTLVTLTNQVSNLSIIWWWTHLCKLLRTLLKQLSQSLPKQTLILYFVNELRIHTCCIVYITLTHHLRVFYRIILVPLLLSWTPFITNFFALVIPWSHRHLEFTHSRSNSRNRGHTSFWYSKI